MINEVFDIGFLFTEIFKVLHVLFVQHTPIQTSHVLSAP